MHVRLKKRVAAAPGYSLLAKAVSCAVSVVKGGVATNRVRREISVSVPTRVATNGPLVNRFVPFLRLEK